jgi:hypothetical protein
MARIINIQTGEIIRPEDNQTVYGTLIDYLPEKGKDIVEWVRLSDLIQTMTGDSITPFNTIAVMIQCIPDIVNCGEECAFLCVFSNTVDYYIMGWDYEEDEKLCNAILQKYYPIQKIVMDY